MNEYIHARIQHVYIHMQAYKCAYIITYACNTGYGMNECMHTFIHYTNVHTYMQTYIYAHTNIHKYTHTYIFNLFIHTYIDTYLKEIYIIYTELALHNSGSSTPQHLKNRQIETQGGIGWRALL